MSDLFKTTVGALRWASLADGISYLVLLGIAMPLKYLAGYPLGVRIVGSLHGFLFLLLCLMLLLALLRRKVNFFWCTVVFLCALVPFAPFFLDRKLRQFDLVES